MKKWLRRIFWVLLIALIVIQFKRIDKSNPPVVESLDFITIESPPQDVTTMFKGACYDCHSHETQYPWYTDIAPLSFWIKGHIDHGRENLNFSEWGTLQEREQLHLLEECEDMIKKEWMPLGSYARMHSKAKLTQEDRQLLIDWITSKY